MSVHHITYMGITEKEKLFHQAPKAKKIHFEISMVCVSTFMGGVYHLLIIPLAIGYLSMVGYFSFISLSLPKWRRFVL